MGVPFCHFSTTKLLYFCMFSSYSLFFCGISLKCDMSFDILTCSLECINGIRYIWLQLCGIFCVLKEMLLKV